MKFLQIWNIIKLEEDNSGTEALPTVTKTLLETHFSNGLVGILKASFYEPQRVTMVI